MKLNKTMAGLLAAAGLAVMAASGASAQQQTFASVTGTGLPADQSTVFTYTGGASGEFETTAGALFSASAFPASNPLSTLTFFGLTASGVATGTGTTADPYNQILSGGSFTLRDSTTNADLLDGSFSGGNVLSGTSKGTTASITTSVTGLTYTGGSYFADSRLANPGSFAIGLTSVNPALSIGTDGYLSAFKAGGTGSFSATPAVTTVPEPATVVPFVLGGLGLLVLAVRKNRRTLGVTA